MKVLRTPDDRFRDLIAYPFEPHYLGIKDADGTDLRLHYVDEGYQTGPTVLMMHGEPSWSYLYRHMIQGLAPRGYRVLAPDLIGFGKSDKPAARTDYTYERHVAWMSAWLTELDLTGITLFAQDWGGLIGLRLVAAFPDRFARVIVANTFLPVGEGSTEGFDNWLEFSQSIPDFPVGALLNGGSERALSAAEMAAYDAPFPDESYKEGARQFPTLVPITPQHASVEENKAAWRVLEQFDQPFLTAFSDKDPVTAGSEKAFQERIPGAKGQPHVTIHNAGHFLQEDQSPRLVETIDGFIGATSR